MKSFSRLIFILALTVVNGFGLSRQNIAQESPASDTAGVISVGEQFLEQSEWAKAEAHFREVIRRGPYNSLWHVYLAVALDKQAKTAEVHDELLKLIKGDEFNSFLVFHEKVVPGKLSFVNTDLFRDETKGIIRYLNAVKQQKKVLQVSEDIGRALGAYAKKHGIAAILDSSRFKKAHFFMDKSLDITDDFIKDYNAQHPE